MLESSNSKLREIIKKFTTSQFSLDTMVGNLSNNANRQGLGYMPKVQPLKPKKTNTRKFAKLTKVHLAIVMMMLNMLKLIKNQYAIIAISLDMLALTVLLFIILVNLFGL